MYSFINNIKYSLKSSYIYACERKGHITKIKYIVYLLLYIEKLFKSLTKQPCMWAILHLHVVSECIINSIIQHYKPAYIQWEVGTV